jgi:hypothetical protein
VIIVLAEDEGCALVAEEFEPGRYGGFFTTNLNLANRCLKVLKGAIRIEQGLHAIS